MICRHHVIEYLQRVANLTIEMVFLMIICFILSAISLYLGDMFWFLYLETPMGQKFIDLFPDSSRFIAELLSFDIVRLSADLTISAFIICMTVSLGSRLLHISRHFYFSIGFFYRILFWGLPLTALVALHISREYGFSDYGLTGVFAAVPTFCLFMSCFRASERVTPEIGDIIRSFTHYTYLTWHWAAGKLETGGNQQFSRFFSLQDLRKSIEAYRKRKLL